MATKDSPQDVEGSQQVLLIVLSVIFMVVTAFGISFRLFTRICVSKKVFLEDGLIVAGTLFAFGLSAVYTVGAYHGFGKHIHDITRRSDLALLHKLSFAIPMLYLAAMLFIRASFLALYHRLDHRKPMRWAVYGLLAIIVAQAFAAGIVQSLSYVPTSKMKSDPGYYSRHASRHTVQSFYNANGIIMAITSLAIYTVPFFMLRELDLPNRQKWAVGALFGLGFLSVIATCIKNYYAWNVFRDPDVFYRLVVTGIWNQVEVHLAILCGSAQSFRVLLKDVFPRCCRSPSEAASQLSPPVVWPPPPSMSYRSDESPIHDSWRGWPESVSSNRCDSALSHGSQGSKQVVEIKRNTGVATMPAGIQQQFRQYPTISTRLSGSSNAWIFQAATNKRFTPPWPLPNMR